MADPKLVSYIRGALKKGYTEETLRKTLLGQGWKASQVNDAFDAVRGYAQAEAQTARTAAQDSSAHAAPQPQASASRPRNVKLICILGFLTSALALTGGLFGLLDGVFLASIGGVGDIGSADAFGLLGSMVMLMSLIPLVIGTIGFFGFYMLWKMRRMGFVIVSIIGVIAIVAGLVSVLQVGFEIFSVLNATLWAVIVGYLFYIRSRFS